MGTSIAPTCAACIWRRGGPPLLAVDHRTAPIHMPARAAACQTSSHTASV